MKTAACWVAVAMVAFFSPQASASALPPAAVAVAGDAALSIIGVAWLAALTARSERWRSTLSSSR